jgi:hypothetical protein
VVVGGGSAPEEGEREGVASEREGDWERESGEAEAVQRRHSGGGVESRHFREEGRGSG